MVTRTATAHRAQAPGVRGCAAFLALAALAWAAGALAAQQTGGVNGDRPSVFLDCATRGCNREYFRTEVTWVNWVRVPESADVHLIMTGQTTGAGGREYQLHFMGRGDLEYDHQLAYQAPPTATDRETLDELVRTIGVGLLHFATLNGFFDVAEDFQDIADLVNSESGGLDPAERVVAQTEVDDPWNFWVFRLGGRTELNGEQTRRTNQVNGNWSASRVTPTWKMNFRANLEYNRREIDLADDSTFVDQRTDWGFSELIAYSLADHWSIGIEGEARKIVRFNQTFRIEFTPALEYSFFPMRRPHGARSRYSIRSAPRTAATSRRPSTGTWRKRAGNRPSKSSFRSASSGATPRSACRDRIFCTTRTSTTSPCAETWNSASHAA